MPSKKGFKTFIVFALGLCIGIAGTRFIASLYQPSREVLAIARSPDGRFDCLVERYEPPWLGDHTEGVPWRVLKLCQAGSADAEALDNNSCFVIHEHESGHGEIGNMKNQIKWEGSDKAIVMFDGQPWYQIRPYYPEGWQDVPSPTTTKPTTAATTNP